MIAYPIIIIINMLEIEIKFLIFINFFEIIYIYYDYLT
jgi:hypothetical protein